MGYLVGYTYRTFNGFCERKWGGTPLESLRERRGGQIPRTFPFGAYVDPRSGEQALPPPPVHDPERSVKRPLEDSGGAGEGGEVPGQEGDGDMEVEIPLLDGSLAPEGGGEPMDLDMILDRVIQHAQNEAMNEFLAGTSRCDKVGGEVEAEGQGSSISVQFGGSQIDVQIAEGVCDELTGHP